MRIGSDKIINIDVRIIAATNAYLEKKIAEGRFRPDLFYRLNVISLNISPLRNRKEDILPLLNHFIGKTYNHLSEKEKEILTSYSWPGNVRELENAAAYYKLLGSLPENMMAHALEIKDHPTLEEEKRHYTALEKDDLELLILKIVAANTSTNSGIGRLAIVNQLCNKGLQVSEGKVKAILKILQEKDLIKSSPGRGGSHITSKGLEKLNK